MIRLILATLLLCQTAWACESYEECINKPDREYLGGGAGASDTHIGSYLKAIAYEIHDIKEEIKKMNQPVQEYVPMGPMLLKKEKMK